MGNITITHTFTDDTVADADEVNENFKDVTDVVNGDIDGTNISSSATLSIATLAVSGTSAFTGTATLAKTIQTVTTYTPAAAGTATINLALGNINAITMPAGNITIAISNETAGQCFLIEITQDAVGSRTVTWMSTVKWADGSAPTLTTTASKRDTFGFIVTGTDTYDGFIVGQNL